MPPRLVRREPLGERIRTAINPLDQQMAFSTWLNSIDWDGFQNSLATPMGLCLNIAYFIARANSDLRGRRRGADDVLRRSTVDRMDGWGAAISYSVCVSSSSSDVGVGDMFACRPFYKQIYGEEEGLLFYFLGTQFWFISWALAIGSLVNSIYCFAKKRRYRLFENNIEIEPQTPSARRVRVDSSPSNSPMRLIENLVEPLLDRPESRQHPTEARDVWEVAIWDPTPLSLRIFALFSPAHVAVYFLSFPIASNPSFHNSILSGYPAPTTNPYTTVFTVLITQILLSAQLIYVQNSFRQQGKDNALIQKEVMHEYDTKFVAPRLNIIKRDVGVQTQNPETGAQASVDCYTPSFTRQSFKTAPNPNYADFTMQNQRSPFKRMPITPSQSTYDSPLPNRGPPRQPQFGAANVRRTASSGTSMRGGDGNSFDDASSMSRNTGYGGSSIHRPTYGDHGRDGSFDEVTTNGGRDTGYGSGNSSAHRSFEDPNEGPRAHLANSNVGMHGLVNMSSEYSRGLSPSKMNSLLKKGSTARGSTYAGSLGTSMGTPGGRNRQAW